MSDEQTKETKAAETVKDVKKAPAATNAKPAVKPKTETKAAPAASTTKEKEETKATEKESTTKVATPAVSTPEEGVETKATEKKADFMDHYRKAYPKERSFHVTSDKQVFLSGDLALAKRHQKTVDASKEVETIER